MPDSTENAYRLVWFQHFHKAGGSSIVDLARLNGETCYPYHENGNPREEKGSLLKIWEYNENELVEFVDECERDQITFVATEWGMPNLSILSQDPRVTLITCLRNPILRLTSNFYFDLYLGYTPARNIESYVGSRNRTITMFNYYSRVLSRLDNDSADVSESDFEAAIENLSKFDCVFALEDGFNTLAVALDWELYEIHSNESRFGIRHILGLLRRGRVSLAFLRILQPKRKPDPVFVQFFED